MFELLIILVPKAHLLYRVREGPGPGPGLRSCVLGPGPYHPQPGSVKALFWVFILDFVAVIKV